MTMREKLLSMLANGAIVSTAELCDAMGFDPTKHNRTRQIKQRARRLGVNLVCLGGLKWVQK
jgi:hypothetical protein